MMESTDHSRWKKLLPPLLLFLVVLAVSLHYCLWKQGMFIDEIYTFGLSNSRYMPYIGGGSGDLLPEQLLTREDFFDYLAVTEDEIPFDYSSVRYNQAADVHPPLHYWIINFASSLAKGHFSKWIGLIPDLIIYLGTVLLLYVLASELFVPYLKNSGEKLQTVRQARWIAALTALLYGLSTIGLSTMLMIRMYVLMSFFTVLLALLVLREIRNPAISCEIGIGWTICLGLMTQYYYVFYAFFLCTCTVILFLCKKQWKSLLRFSLFAFAGVVLMLLWFPAVITQMTADKMVSGGSAIENFENLSAWPSRLRYYFGQIRHGMPAAVLLSFFSIAGTLVALLWRTRSEEKSQKPPYSEFVVLFFPVIPTIMTAAILSPVVEGRYIYNIMPFFALFAGLCMCLCCTRLSFVRKPVFPAAAAMLAIILSLRLIPSYIYEDHREYNRIVEEHATAPCIYMTEYYSPVTQDMLQLIRFENVYICGDPSSEGLSFYLEQNSSEECVVYIDTDGFWSSGFNPQEMLESLLALTDYSDYIHLYKYGNSDTYLLVY